MKRLRHALWTSCAVAVGVSALAACTRRGGGPHLQLASPSQAPNFGDAPSVTEESAHRGYGGGGGASGSSGEGSATNAASGGAASVVGPIVGGALGVGAAAAAVGAGLVTCEPGSDTHGDASTLDLCSGQRSPGTVKTAP